LPVETEHCGSCQACLEICPTRAIVAPYRLDARRCIAYLTIEHHGPIPEEFRAPIGNRIYGCDDCQLICPWNKFAVSLKLPGLRARPSISALELVEAMSWDKSAFLHRTEGSAIRRIGYRRWLRNVAVALGNLLESSGPDPEPREIRLALRAIEVLRARREGVDPMVAEHIDWALRRLEAGIARSPSGARTPTSSARS
jgi:epoxyqueuosine reductase